MLALCYAPRPLQAEEWHLGVPQRQGREGEWSGHQGLHGNWSGNGDPYKSGTPPRALEEEVVRWVGITEGRGTKQVGQQVGTRWEGPQGGIKLVGHGVDGQYISCWPLVGSLGKCTALL